MSVPTKRPVSEQKLIVVDHTRNNSENSNQLQFSDDRRL